MSKVRKSRYNALRSIDSLDYFLGIPRTKSLKQYIKNSNFLWNFWKFRIIWNYHNFHSINQKNSTIQVIYKKKKKFVIIWKDRKYNDPKKIIRSGEKLKKKKKIFAFQQSTFSHRNFTANNASRSLSFARRKLPTWHVQLVESID